MMMRIMFRWVTTPAMPTRIRMKPVTSTTFDTGKSITAPPAIALLSKAVDNDAELAADLDAEQNRQERDGAGAVEGAELAKRQHAVVEKPPGKDHTSHTDQDEQDARHGFGGAEKLHVQLRAWPCKQQQHHAGGYHRPTLKAAAGRQMPVHDDVGGEDRNDREKDLR